MRREGEPYVCLGCGWFFRENPDPDADNCPVCGEKVMPKQLQNIRERAAGRHLACLGGCAADVDRADGGCICVCGEEYREHPRCAQSAFEAGGTCYAANVLCDGRHVHL